MDDRQRFLTRHNKQMNMAIQFCHELYVMDVKMFQKRIQQKFQKDKAYLLIKQFNKWHAPIGCVLRFFVNCMSNPQRIKLYGTYASKSLVAGGFLVDMNEYVTIKRRKLLKQMHNILPRKLPRALQHIVDEYISRHFFEQYDILCEEDKQKLFAWHYDLVMRHKNKKLRDANIR